MSLRTGCAHCHTPQKRGGALFLIGPEGSLSCDILWLPREGDECFCSPACMLAFVEPQIEAVQRVFTDDFCHICGEDVQRGIAYSAPYESCLDTIGAGVAHTDCFLDVLRKDVVHFVKREFQPWFRTGREPPEYDAEPPPRRPLKEELEQIAKDHEGDPQAAVSHMVLRLFFG